MRSRIHPRTVGLLAASFVAFLRPAAGQGPGSAAAALRDFRDAATRLDGDPNHGRELFNDDHRLSCATCHSVDGSSSRAGPDLFAVGDAYPRAELIRAILEPSASIAVGYETTIVETTSGDEHQGIVIWFGQVPGLSNGFLGVHQSGRIGLVEKRANGDGKSLFADLSPEVFSQRGPNGLLGLAFHPRFRENHRYFLKHQVLEAGEIVTIVVERRASTDFKSDSGQPSRRLWQAGSSTENHTGGCIGFGPDGFLYIAMGDTGPQQDPQGHGQDPATHLGKILRIDVDRESPGRSYAIPPDNPYANHDGVLPEIWAMGFREPWRFTFDRQTGELWVGDVGQDRVEEVSIVRRGENGGWNVYEGFEPFSNKYRREGTTFMRPVFAYRRKYGNSVTGGFVYRGDPKSSFHGAYIFGDYTSRRIFGLKQRDRVLESVRQIGTSPQGIASFAEDDRGELYVVGYEGLVYRMDFTGANFDGSTTIGQPR